MRLRCAQPRAVRAHCVVLTAHLPKWIQTNLATRGETKPADMIESFVAPPRTPGRLFRKNVAGGSAPRPRSAGGLLGGSSQRGSGAQPQRGSGAKPQRRAEVWGGAPRSILATKPPRGWFGAEPKPPRAPRPGYGIVSPCFP